MKLFFLQVNIKINCLENGLEHSTELCEVAALYSSCPAETPMAMDGPSGGWGGNHLHPVGSVWLAGAIDVSSGV